MQSHSLGTVACAFKIEMLGACQTTFAAQKITSVVSHPSAFTALFMLLNTILLCFHQRESSITHLLVSNMFIYITSSQSFQITDLFIKLAFHHVLVLYYYMETLRLPTIPAIPMRNLHAISIPPINSPPLLASINDIATRNFALFHHFTMYPLATTSFPLRTNNTY